MDLALPRPLWACMRVTIHPKWRIIVLPQSSHAIVMSLTLHVPQNYHHHLHHPYYPPHLSSRNPSGSSQNPQPCPLPYYTSTHSELFNVHGSEYPCYPPYYPRPPPHPNYLSTRSNSTTLSTSIGSVIGLGAVWDKYWGKDWWGGRGGSNGRYSGWCKEVDNWRRSTTYSGIDKCRHGSYCWGWPKES